MFEDAEQEIDRILALVAKCPEPLQAKCFEILLTAYTATKTALTSPPGAAPLPSYAPPAPPAPVVVPGIPEAAKTRFAAVAARLRLQVDQLTGLFDFQSDPFVYHALAVPGGSKAEKTRNVALLLAAKSYLAGGQWSADWKEFRAMCVDQGCYDRTNMSTYMSGKEGYFKTATASEGIALGSAGIAAAEPLLTTLASPRSEAE